MPAKPQQSKQRCSPKREIGNKQFSLTRLFLDISLTDVKFHNISRISGFQNKRSPRNTLFNADLQTNIMHPCLQIYVHV